MKKNIKIFVFVVYFIILNIFAFAQSIDFKCTFSNSSKNAIKKESPNSKRNSLLTQTTRMMVIYCVPNNCTSSAAPGWITNFSNVDLFYNHASMGNHRLDYTLLTRNANECFKSDYNLFGGGSAPASDTLIKNVLEKVDSLYNFADFDIDGDGYVDFLVFNILNYPTGIKGLGTADYLFPNNGEWESRDTCLNGGHIKVRNSYSIIQRFNYEVHNFTIPIHEYGHSIGLPDMDYFDGPLDHYAVGDFDAMSTGGFGGISSQFNPWFREYLGWITPTQITSNLSNQILSNYVQSGSVYKYTPTNYPSIADGHSRWYISYHKKGTMWEDNWPFNATNGGVLIWHVIGEQITKYDASDYRDKRRMPIDLEQASGKWNWSGGNITTPNPISGFDSLETFGTYHDVDEGSNGCFYLPDSGKTFSFYTNPSSNFYNKDDPYNQDIPSGFTVKNIIISGGTAYADFSINDYTVSKNATMVGKTWRITENIIVPSGVTLTIDPDAYLIFSPGKTLTVYGTLHAVGSYNHEIFFTSSLSTTTWGGIVFSGNGAGNSVMSYCYVENVQTYGGSAINISNVPGNVEISYCMIRNCNTYQTYGISYNNSNGYIAKNKIESNGNGINVYFSSPSFGKPGIYPSSSSGNNYIYNNANGVTASYYSTPYMGSINNSQVSYNMIMGSTTAHLSASSSSDVLAELNYWDPSPVLGSNILVSGGSSVSFTPYLATCPPLPFKINQLGTGSKIPFIATNENKTDLNDLLKQAKDNQFNKKYDEAIKIYKSIISSSPDAKESLFALSGLLSVFRDNNDPEILKYIDKLPKKDGDFDATSKMALASGYVIAERTDDALNIFKDIVKKYNQTEHEKNALMQTALVQYFNKKDEKTANSILDDLDLRFKDDKDVAMVKWLVKGRGSNNQNNFDKGTTYNPTDSLNTKKISNENDLIQNYPNPFNPSTTISYNIPKDGQVKLVVYDILGKEIKTLVNEVKSAGMYSLQFDANKLSSGTYYCRIIITPSNGGKSIIQQKQMQVLK